MTNGMAVSVSALMATATQPPANTTARPAEPMAVPIDSSTLRPLARSNRWRVRTNNA